MDIFGCLGFMRIRGIDAGRRYSSQRQNSMTLEMLLLFCCSSSRTKFRLCARRQVTQRGPQYFSCPKTSVHKFRALFGNCELLCISCLSGVAWQSAGEKSRQFTSPSNGCCGSKSAALLPLDDHFQFSIFHRLHEDLVVAFALICVGDGEVGDGPVEFVALAEVSADLCRLTAPGVRMCEG